MHRGSGAVSVGELPRRSVDHQCTTAQLTTQLCIGVFIVEKLVVINWAFSYDITVPCLSLLGVKYESFLQDPF